MKKSTLQRSLNYLKKILEDDDLVAKADDLLNFVENLNDDEAKSSGEFTVPSIVSDHPEGYALFSDGACRGNPGPGAWGMVGQKSNGDIVFQASGLDTRTTNNRMELLGAIEALRSLIDHFNENKPTQKPLVRLYSDSKYVVDGITKWVPGWKSRGWKKADKKEPENVDLWKELDQVCSMFSNLEFEWVKGHSGHPQNEYCDRLANEALDDSGY